MNVLLTLCFAAVFWPILHKGSLSFLDKTSNLLALAAFLPLVLRPWKKAPAPLALLHDLLLLGSASAVSVVVVEYMVKGGSVGLEQSFWQGWLCYRPVRSRLSDHCAWTARGLRRHGHQPAARPHRPLRHAVPRHAGHAERRVLHRHGGQRRAGLLCTGRAVRAARREHGGAVLRARLPDAASLEAVRPLVCARAAARSSSLRSRRMPFTGLGITGTGINFWASSRSYSEFYYFLRCAGRSIVRAPEGYSADGLQTLAEDYKGEQGTKTPNIIVIMNESFSDLGIVGNFETNEDYMPFVHSMQKGQKNTITGNLLVSTFGGGTANTEFEFLAGDTMAFLPFGCSPYQMYVKSAMPSLVGALEAQNYQTVAMHPYLSTSWNRPQVYQSFGFDEQCYEDDFPERCRARPRPRERQRKL